MRTLGGNGNPLQCSCLENPRDRGAWWAAVYGVAQSRTRLKRLSSSSSSRRNSTSSFWWIWYNKSSQAPWGYMFLCKDFQRESHSLRGKEFSNCWVLYYVLTRDVHPLIHLTHTQRFYVYLKFQLLQGQKKSLICLIWQLSLQQALNVLKSLKQHGSRHKSCEPLHWKWAQKEVKHLQWISPGNTGGTLESWNTGFAAGYPCWFQHTEFAGLRAA